jgi:hypothetical protein
MQLLVEQFVALSLLVLGLSHAAQPGRWVALFTDFLPRPYTALVIGTFTLPLGLAVVLTHNVWVLGLPVVVTVCGWGWTVKSVVYLLRPQTLDVWEPTATGPGARRKFVAAGLLMAGLGAALTWHAFTPPAA